MYTSASVTTRGLASWRYGRIEVRAKLPTGRGMWPFDAPHFLILNAAIGGAWGGLQGVDDSIFPQGYYIDYVRVYEEIV